VIIRSRVIMVISSQLKFENESNSLVTNRLQNLERERERLEEMLDGNPVWRAFLEAERRRAARLPGGVLSDATATALANDEMVVGYLKVVEEITSLKAKLPESIEAQLEPELEPEHSTLPLSAASVEPPPTPEPIPEPAPFRTRLSMKSPVTSNKPPAVQTDMQPLQARPSHADDLTMIRGIGRALAARLNEIGVWTFEAIANWDRHEVRRVRDALDLGKRIWRENWIEQAALQQMRLAEAAVLLPEGVATTSKPQVDVEADQRAGDQPRTTFADVKPAGQQRGKVGRKRKRLPAPGMHRFVYIRGISDSMAEEMRSAGVKSLGEIVNWSRADVKWFQAILGEEARISRDQWIEQARLLSSGVWTRYALRVVGGETRQLVKQPVPLVAVAKSSKKYVGLTAPEKCEDTVIAPMATAVVASLVAPVVAQAQEIVVADAGSVLTERFDPMRSLTTKVTLGKLKRPPPDLGRQGRHRVHREPQRGVVLPTQQGQEAKNATAPAAEADVSPETAPSTVQLGREAANTSVAPAASLMQALSDPRPDETLIADQEISERIAEAGTGELSEQELSDIVAADDWSDADALIIRRVDAEPSVSPMPSLRLADDATSSLPNAMTDTSPVIETRAAGAVGPIDQLEDEADLAWGDEAAVTIVSRARPNDGIGRENEVSAKAAAETPVRSMPPVRERLKHLPELIARRMPDARDADDDYGVDHAGYRDPVEEATVTIIRAEASETDAGSIVRTDVANDVGAADEPRSVRSVRKIGSKFLKALTGD
jgi:predicted flap endonuclease-1-like 5' DNA nuclease